MHYPLTTRVFKYYHYTMHFRIRNFYLATNKSTSFYTIFQTILTCHYYIFYNIIIFIQYYFKAKKQLCIYIFYLFI